MDSSFICTGPVLRVRIRPRGLQGNNKPYMTHITCYEIVLFYGYRPRSDKLTNHRDRFSSKFYTTSHAHVFTATAGRPKTHWIFHPEKDYQYYFLNKRKKIHHIALVYFKKMMWVKKKRYRNLSVWAEYFPITVNIFPMPNICNYIFVLLNLLTK